MIGSVRKRRPSFVPVVCKRCGGVGMVESSNAKRQLFCSRSCWRAWKQEHANPTPHVMEYASSAQQLPDGEPRRYVSAHGYVRLRWKVGTRKYVEAWEHRIVAGAHSGEAVHHRDRVRDNNEPSNLERMDPLEHCRLHGEERRIDRMDQIVAEYVAGATLTELSHKYHCRGLYRAIARCGVHMRSRVEAGRSRRLAHFDESHMVQFYKSGRGFEDTAREFGVSTSVVQRVLREHGIASRRAGRPTDAERRERGLL